MTDIVQDLRQCADVQSHEEWHYTRPKLLAAADEIERLLAALKRVSSINDNPRIYNQDIEDVIQKVLPTQFGGHQQYGGEK